MTGAKLDMDPLRCMNGRFDVFKLLFRRCRKLFNCSSNPVFRVLSCVEEIKRSNSKI